MLGGLRVRRLNSPVPPPVGYAISWVAAS